MPLRNANIGLSLHNSKMLFSQMGGHAGGDDIQMGGHVAHAVEPPLLVSIVIQEQQT